MRFYPARWALAVLTVFGGGTLLLPVTANATMIAFYNATNPGTVGRLPTTYNFGTVTATAGQITSGVPKALTVANFSYPQPDELGLGVCGSVDGGSLCGLAGPLQQLNLSTSLWSGDITEIDNLGDNESLRLTVNAGSTFAGGFILGSLDANSATNNYEDGVVTYGANTVRFARTAGGAAITAGVGSIVQAGPSFGSNVFLLTLGNFTPAITQVTFGAGGTSSSGTNNDYLVAAADVLGTTVETVVPVPAAVWLFGSTLGMLSVVRRKATA